MNLKELSQLDIKDLKNINFSIIKESLLQNPSTSVNIVLVLLSVVIGLGLINSRFAESKRLKSENAVLKEKDSTVKVLKQTIEEYNTAFESFPKPIETMELGSLVSKIARKNNIQILSYSPEKRNESPLSNRKKEDPQKNKLTTSSVRVSTSAKKYKDLIGFIKNLEELDFALRLVSLNIEPLESKFSSSSARKRFSFNNNKNLQLGANFSIEIVYIKK